MKSLWYISIFVFLTAILFDNDAYSGDKPLKDYLTNLPFQMPDIIEPIFPDHKTNITDYGAVADGITLNTKAFADAIKACAKAGGGTVLVPSGAWLTGPIQLVSNINLKLERGALVQFSKDYSEYPFIENPSGRGRSFGRTQLISAYKAQNIAITGDGIFDGGGEAWRYVLKEDMNKNEWNGLIARGGIVSDNGEQWWPSKEAMNAEAFLKSKKELTKADYESTKEYFRPALVNLV